MSAIKTENLGKKINKHWIFKNISFRVESGETLLVTGENGSGKSVLLLTLAQIFKPDAGSLSFSNPNRPHISYSPFHLGLDEFLSVKDNVRGWSSEAHDVKEQLHVWQMNILAGKNVEQLSSGQRKRTSLARAFAAPADIFLLDEPMAGLDHAYLKVLIKQIRAKQEQGCCCIIATHHAGIFNKLDAKSLSLTAE